jgi:hypothetical protein
MPGRNFTQAAADLRSILDHVADVLGIDVNDARVKESAELLELIRTLDHDTHKLVSTLMTARFNCSRLQDEIEASSKQGYLSHDERHDLAQYVTTKHEAAHALADRLRQLAAS